MVDNQLSNNISDEDRVDLYLDGIMSGLTKKEAALKAGYSESVANSPKQIEKSRLFKEALENWIPETVGVKKLMEGLDATENMMTKDGEIKTAPDFSTQHKYLETFYKLKGKLKGHGEVNNTYIDKAIVVRLAKKEELDSDNLGLSDA